jgi:hypothetical protein
VKLSVGKSLIMGFSGLLKTVLVLSSIGLDGSKFHVSKDICRVRNFS